MPKQTPANSSNESILSGGLIGVVAGVIFALCTAGIMTAGVIGTFVAEADLRVTFPAEESAVEAPAADSPPIEEVSEPTATPIPVDTPEPTATATQGVDNTATPNTEP